MTQVRGNCYHGFMPAKNGEKPATRSDLAQVRTELGGGISKLDGKIDCVKSELKEDIAKLDAKIDRVAGELVKTQSDVRDIKASMSTKDDISRVLKAIDAFAKQTMDNRRTLLVYDDILGKHETRIAALEAKSS